MNLTGCPFHEGHIADTCEPCENDELVVMEAEQIVFMEYLVTLGEFGG